MDSPAIEKTEEQHFHDLLTQFETAMLVTRGEEGELRARPMGIAKVEDDSSLWFFTSVESGKVHDIESDDQVQVTFQNDRGTYVSLSGAAELFRDPALARELWKDAFRVWFPEGEGDPSIALIHVIPSHGEYWDNEGFNRIKYLLAAAKAYASGEKLTVEDIEQHGEVQL